MTSPLRLVAGAVALSLSALFALQGCSSSTESSDGGNLVGAMESDLGGSVSYPIGTTLQTTANLNFRTGPSTGYKILRVIPLGGQVVTVNQTSSNNGFLNVKYSGSTGWAYAAYLQPVNNGGGGDDAGGGGGDAGGGNTSGASGAIARAKEGVGFSYWWGHGRFLSSGPTSSNKGACSGSCPSCSHSGSYGADCSGYVAKAWQVPSSNSSVSVDSHPYSTYNFYNQTTSWKTVSRGSMKAADALVYRSGSSGHILMYESGDAWGSLWSYEARGCSYGIVHNLRTASSAYKAIRRDGY